MGETMLEREQVVHVARLARLALDEDELQKMASELSAVLDHVERIRELDLTDVEPTSHVIDVAGVMRADEPQPSLPRDVILAAAPESVDGGFGVPSPGPGGE
jgi:aspartyl-tRNA(Asn)/glutamyl-tRNA(Gln) amidotransferase subunit C